MKRFKNNFHMSKFLKMKMFRSTVHVCMYGCAGTVLVVPKGNMWSFKITKYRTYRMSCDRKCVFTGSPQPTDVQDDSNM